MKNHFSFFGNRNTFILVALFLYTIAGLAQEMNPQVKRVQRGIFIYNLSQQIIGYSPKVKDEIIIGVLGPDRTIIDLKVMSQKRTIMGKPVSVVTFQKVKDIQDVDILYVNNKYNYDSNYILSKIEGEKTLLITEDYKYNASMINIVGVGEGFEYEINKSLLIKQGFNWTPSLEQNAISSSQKWKSLFKEAQNLLELEQQEVLEKEKEIIAKDTAIHEQNAALYNIKDTLQKEQGKLKQTQSMLANKQDSLNSLWVLHHMQSQKYEDKVRFEKELEAQIESQLSFLKQQQLSIEKSAIILSQQRDSLKIQSEEIKTQDTQLASQKKIISQQNTIVALLAAVTGLFALAVFLLWSGYRKKKRINVLLSDKNQQIELQSKELAFKNKELEQFAYIASHDLKEPINTISSLIKLIEDDFGDSFPETVKKSFTFMNDSTDRMRDLIDVLLQHSKLGVIGTRVQVDTNILLNEIKEDLKNLIHKSNTHLQVDLLPEVYASSTELRLVFQNLIANAIKFRATNRSPIIEVSSEKIIDPSNPQKAMWQFSVEDNGIGIAEQYKEKVFAIFQRLHNKEEYEGTGIGLAHCKKVINAHGGKIWVTSKEGEGSTFYFTIPINS